MKLGVAASLEGVHTRIAEACVAASRPPADVRLVAVSKKHPAEAILEARAAGQSEFGENYAQELADKASDPRLEGVLWHHIGRLQTSTLKLVATHATYVHGLDQLKHAEGLSRHALGLGRSLRVLIAVNFGDESQKGGVAPDAVAALRDKVVQLPGLHVVGLMTLPPPDLMLARAQFDALRTLRDRLGGAPQLPELSMGMSHDMHAAIAAGATMVRVGTAIFGERTKR